MQSEIEVKFLSVDLEEMRNKLKALGAVREQPMRLMRRVAIDNEFMRTNKDSFLRVRDEGDKVTMTYKQYDSATVDGTKEIEVVVSSFEDAVAILGQTGLSPKTYQETRRETWHIDDVEVVIDEWPWLNMFIEVEGKSEQAIREVAEKLGFDWNDGIFGDVMAAYRVQYPHLGIKDTIATTKEVKFGDPLPALLER